jgi:hypothetical protein
MNYPTTSEEIKKLVIKSDGKIENRGFEVYGITLPDIIREFSKDFMLETVNVCVQGPRTKDLFISFMFLESYDAKKY